MAKYFRSFFVLGFSFECSLALLALLLGWWWGVPVLDQMDWQWRDAVIGAGAAVPLFMLFVWACHQRRGPLKRIMQFLDEVARPALQDLSAIELALLSVAAGVGEEMLFRGLLQPALTTVAEPLVGVHFGVAAGLLAASVAFGVAHCITPTYALLATLIGMLLGGLLLATGNLFAPITAHALYDWLALLYFLRRESPPPEMPGNGWIDAAGEHLSGASNGNGSQTEGNAASVDID